MNEKLNYLKMAAVDAEVEIHSYSGRGMMGKKCAAFTTDNQMRDIFFLGMASEGTGQEGREQMAEIIKSVQTDSMGLSRVVYFPSVEWEDS